MAITINISPDPVSLIGNPIVFQVQSDLFGSSELDYLKINLRIERYVNNQVVHIDTLEYSPNRLAQVNFDIHSCFEGLIPSKLTYPSPNPIVAHPDMVVKFRVAIWESYYQNGGIQNDTTLYSNEFWAINGQLDDAQLAQWNDYGKSFHTEWLEKGKFLTYMPRKTDVQENQPVRLFYLALPGINTTLRMLVRQIQGATEKYSLAASMPVSSGTLYEIACGPNELNIAEETTSYEITLTDVTWQYVSETFIFNIDRAYYERNSFFAFTNSFNTYDVLWTRGLRSKKNNYKRTSVERTMPISAKGSDPTLIDSHIERVPEFSQNSGLIKSEKMFDVLDEFFGSKRIYLLENLYPSAIKLTTNNYNSLDDFKKPVSIAFSFIRAFSGKAFNQAISELLNVNGDFNFAFSDDYNTGTNPGDNTTPSDGTEIDVQYRCVLNLNGVNTGYQEKRTQLSDGNGGTYWTDWEDAGENTTSCPLPPTTVILEAIYGGADFLDFRAKLDRSLATDDYTVYLNRDISLPSGFAGLTNPEATETIPMSLVISKDSTYSNTVRVDRTDIYAGGSVSVEIASITPAWLIKDPATITVSGTKIQPIQISILQQWTANTIVDVSLIATRAVPQNVSCIVNINGVNTTVTIATGETQKRIQSVATHHLVEDKLFVIGSLPTDYYTKEPSTLTLSPNQEKPDLGYD